MVREPRDSGIAVAVYTAHGTLEPELQASSKPEAPSYAPQNLKSKPPQKP